jgi:hypothetical protein
MAVGRALLEGACYGRAPARRQWPLDPAWPPRVSWRTSGEAEPVAEVAARMSTADFMVVQAVCCELVSAGPIPCLTGKYREISHFEPSARQIGTRKE